MERRRFSETMAFEWQTAFVVSQYGVPCSLPSSITIKVLKNCKTFSSRQRQRLSFLASRPIPWSRGLHHLFFVSQLSYLAGDVRYLLHVIFQKLMFYWLHHVYCLFMDNTPAVVWCFFVSLHPVSSHSLPKFVPCVHLYVQYDSDVMLLAMLQTEFHVS